MNFENILTEINTTLDHLLTSAENIRSVSAGSFSPAEIKAFQKKQNDLLAHLINMDKKLDAFPVETKKTFSQEIRKKLKKFERINNRFVNIAEGNVNIIRFEKKKKQRELKTNKV